MYPVIRFIQASLVARRQPPLRLFDAHVSMHRCLPWDLDPWIELNNGRTLTLYDLGRLPLMQRNGMMGAVRSAGWGMTVAGSTVRYRRRIQMFDRFTMISRVIGWDNRFFYVDQSMWRGDDCLNQVMLRTAITSARGIVPPAELTARIGHAAAGPALPGWVVTWAAAETARPWPPESGRHLPD